MCIIHDGVCVHGVCAWCVCAWCVHGVCIVCVWCVYGVCMVCVHGVCVCMVCAWCVDGVVCAGRSCDSSVNEYSHSISVNFTYVFPLNVKEVFLFLQSFLKPFGLLCTVNDTQ